MASRLSELIVKITGNADGFRGVMAEVNRDLKVSIGQAENASRGFAKLGSTLSSLGQAATLGFSLPIAGFATAAVKAAADLEALKLGLKAVTGSAAEAEKQFNELREVAKLPGLGLEEAVRGATNLQAIGFSAQKSQEILLQFGNALASVGRGREDLEEVIRQLGQMASRGKVTADNLKPIMERVPQVAAIIRKEFGTIDTEVLQKMGISAEQLTNTLLTELGKLPRVTGGLKNDFENLRDSIRIAMADTGAALAPFAKELIDNFAVPAIQKIGELGRAFQSLPESVKGFSVGFAALAAALPIVVFGFGTLVEKILVLKAAFAAAAPVIAGVVGLLATPAAAAVAGIGAVAAIASKARDTFSAWMTAAAGARKTAFEAGSAAIVAAEGIAKVAEAAGTAGAGAGTGGSGAAGAVIEFNHALAQSKLETRILAAELGILTSASNDYVKQLAELRLGMRVWTDGQASAALRALQADVGGLNQEVSKLGSVGNPSILRMVDGTDQLAKSFQLAALQAEMMQTVFTLPTGEEFAKRILFDLQKLPPAMKATGAAARQMSQQVSLIVNDLAKSLTDLVFEGGKLKDRLSDAFESIGKALLRSALETQLGRIANLVKDLLSNVPGLGKVLGAVFGGASSAGGSAASTAGGVAGSVGGIGGGASSAASGFFGAVGAISGAVTAVSSVIGNFQFAHMNTALGRIEESTRFSQIHLKEILERGVNQFLSFLPSIHDRLRTIVDQGIRMYGSSTGNGGGNTININVYGGDADEVLAQLVTKLKLFGVLPQNA